MARKGNWTFTDLKRHYELHQAAQPGTMKAHWHLGLTYQMAGQTEKMEDEYEAFVKCAVEELGDGSPTQAMMVLQTRLNQLLQSGADTDGEECHSVRMQLEYVTGAVKSFKSWHKRKHNRSPCAVM